MDTIGTSTITDYWLLPTPSTVQQKGSALAFIILHRMDVGWRVLETGVLSPDSQSRITNLGVTFAIVLYKRDD